MAGRGIVIKIEGDGESARRALELVKQHLHETGESAKHEASEIAEAMEGVKKAFELVGIGLGLRELVERLKEGVEHSLEFGEAIEKASKKTGLAAETLSVLHTAATITGSDFDGLTGAVAKMDKAIGSAADGNKKSVGLMRALGLDAKDLADRQDGAEIAFRKFTATIAATENPVRRAQLAQQLLGKAGAAQIPMLLEVGEHWDEFTEKAKANGTYLDGEHARVLAENNQKLNNMKDKVLGASIAVTDGLLPGLTEMFSVIGSGTSPLETMNHLGQNLAKTFAFVAEVIYTAAGAAEDLFSIAEGGDWSKRDRDAAEELYKKAHESHDIAFGYGKGTAMSSADALALMKEGGAEKHEGSGEGGFKGVGDTEHLEKLNAIAQAATALEVERGRAELALQKALSQQMVAELENQHKLQLVTDQDYFAEKLRLQLEEIDKEDAALAKSQGTLEALKSKQQKDGALHRDGQGRSAEELKTQREIVQVQEQRAALEARRGSLNSGNVAEVTLAQQASELAGQRLAADLERERNAGIEAQIALIQREHEEEAKKIRTGGGSDADVANERALGDVAVRKLQIEDVNRRITETENDYRRAVEQVNDRVEKGQLSKRNGAREISKLNAEEAAQLQAMVERYDELARTLGGPFLQTAAQLHAELDKLNRGDNREGAAFGKTLADGVENMANRMVEATARGKQSFSQMVESIGDDALQLALKLAEQKWLTPLLEGALGGLGGGGGGSAVPGVPDNFFGLLEHHADGGTINGLSVVGERGPELWSPPSKGGTITPHETLTKLAEGGGGGGGRGVSIVSNVINQTKNPVTAQPSQVSYDSEMRQFVVHTILEDHAQGGPISQAARG